MRVYLCEKPSQARDIAAVLGANRKSEGFLGGDDVAVTWCFGHLFETAPPESYDPALKKWSLDTLPILPAQWKLELKSSAAKQFKAIKALVKRASTVVIATDADRKAAREALDALDIAANTDKTQVGKLNRAFHMSLVRPLHRQVTLQIIERLNIICERYVGKHLEPAGRDDRAHNEHLALLDLWSAGKSEEASALMHQHIAMTLDDLRKQFETEKTAKRA